MNFDYVIHSDDSDFESKVKDILLYHKIKSVKQIGDQTAELVLDNGTAIRTEGNQGCCGCNNGWYYLNTLNNCDNAIMNVECTDNEKIYHIFVYADNRKINLVEYDGFDNGYYGTGYHLFVSIAGNND